MRSPEALFSIGPTYRIAEALWKHLILTNAVLSPKLKEVASLTPGTESFQIFTRISKNPTQLSLMATDKFPFASVVQDQVFSYKVL